MTLATFSVSCCGAARRSMRVRTTPCTVSGSDRTRRSAPGAIRHDPVGDGDGTGVTQRVGQLLAEERVPAGVLADELRDQPRNRAHPQPLGNQRGHIVGRQGIELEPLTSRRVPEPPVLGDGIAERTQGQHQERRGSAGRRARPAPTRPSRTSGHPRARSAAAVASATIRRAPDQQPAQVVGPYRPFELSDDLIGGQVKGQHVGEQRGQTLKVGPGAEPIQHPGRAAPTAQRHPRGRTPTRTPDATGDRGSCS